MRLRIPTYYSGSFSVSKTNKWMFCDFSDLIGTRSKEELGSKLFEDKRCDKYGFYVISEKTGDKQMFYYDRDQRDNEGELVANVFKPVNDELRKAGWEVHVLND